MTAGVYTITSPSGKQYVGSAVNLHRRWSLHRASLSAGSHHNRPLLAAATKYGVDALAFTKVFECAASEVLAYEQAFIDGLKPAYNTNPTAGSRLGAKHTPEARSKISANASKGRVYKPLTEEHRAAISAALAGRRRDHSPEHRAQIGAALRGRKRSPEAIEKHRATNAAKRQAGATQ